MLVNLINADRLRCELPGGGWFDMQEWLQERNNWELDNGTVVELEQVLDLTNPEAAGVPQAALDVMFETEGFDHDYPVYLRIDW